MQPGSSEGVRRKKVRHFDEAGHAHFLTFSCYHRLALLSKDRSRRWLVDALAAARKKHGFDLWAWVIMPEHVHLLIFPSRPSYRIAAILADIKRPVGQAAIDWVRNNRPDFLSQLRVENRGRVYHRFWQAGPGRDHNIHEPETAHRIIEYIHNNPVSRGLVSKPEAWPWSSARDWAGDRNGVLPIDKTIPSSF
jgi:putative transposase